MKFILSLFFLFFTTWLFFQNIYIEYEEYNLDTKLGGVLIANKSNSLYTSNYLKQISSDTITKISDNEITIKPSQRIIPEKKFYATKENNDLYAVVLPPKGKPIVALDSLPNMPWEIYSNDTKVILGFECIKATTFYRGSEIVAYFTTEIPIPFGPFKFKGLPGIILEAFNINSSDRHIWKAVKIKYPYAIDKSLLFDKNEYGVEVVSLKSLVIKFQRRLNTIDRRTKSSLPRGTTVQTGTTQRKGIEKIYEWEK